MFQCLRGPDRSAGHVDKDLQHSTTNKWADRTGGGLPEAADINTATLMDEGR